MFQKKILLGDIMFLKWSFSSTIRRRFAFFNFAFMIIYIYVDFFNMIPIICVYTPMQKCQLLTLIRLFEIKLCLFESFSRRIFKIRFALSFKYFKYQLLIFSFFQYVGVLCILIPIKLSCVFLMESIHSEVHFQFQISISNSLSIVQRTLIYDVIIQIKQL